jgi:hypothetical protein
MEKVKEQLKTLFSELNVTVEKIDRERRAEGLLPIPKAKVQLLGQMSLLSNDKVSPLLSLAQTGDLDALLRMEHVVKVELKRLLQKHGLIYDEDSSLIWIPPGAMFEALFDLDHVTVESIDPESALVSKAVKAHEKNKQLIREAIASDAFPTLVDRILANGGKLENFV